MDRLNPHIVPSAGVAGVKAYSVPKHGAPVDLILNANEGQAPPADLLQRILAVGPDVMRRYPDTSAVQLLLAQRLGVESARILVTAGGDDALDRLCRAILGPGKRLLTTDPSFEMLPRYAHIMGAEVREVLWPQGAFPIEEMIAQVTEYTALIAFVSPNNPTGSVGTADDLRRLAAAAPHAVIIADLAYVEFADEDITSAALTISNCVVVRTLSKAWGLAGLRVGYAIGHPEIIGWMRASGGPYAVARPSVALAAARLEQDGGEMEAFVAQVRKDRAEIEAALAECGASTTNSQANFVFTLTENAAWIADAMAGLGIAIRSYPGHARLSNALRITCPGNAGECRRVTHAIRTALLPQAMIFDLDGVIADVSHSYRRAIIDTAASFGANISFEEVVAVKAQGNANNDWEVTHRLVTTAGKDVPYEAVRERFEELYQGTEEKPGLRSTEKMLCDVGVLERIAAMLPIAIVTGRPRGDAERFLKQCDIARLFSHVICMEDAKMKPDPAPVLLALQKLGVERAWMIGDTPDDIVAARAAGVIPLGIIAPGERVEVSSSVLTRAGAARVVTQLGDLETLVREKL